jgi:archaemetzincin
MGPRDESTPVKAVDFLLIGSFPGAQAEELVTRTSRRLAAPCRLITTPLDIDPPLLPGRVEVDATYLVEQLEEVEVEPGILLAGLTMRDLATPVFTFVFGLARHHGHAAVISLARLRPEFYGLPPDPEVTYSRAVTEILHELGHLGGLDHCPDFGCLMHFAGSAQLIDIRGTTYCPSCRKQLRPGLVAPVHEEGR